MENAAQALRIGAWVLIFVMALTICINAFSQAKTCMNTILSYNDREYYTTYMGAKKDADGSIITQRTVSYQEIVPTIYRAYKENFRIRFDDIECYEKYNSTTGSYEPIYYIDLEKQGISEIKVPKNVPEDEDITLKEYFIRRIIYGNRGKFNNSRDDWCKNQLNVRFLPDGLYDAISSNSFTEYLGIYYQEEVDTGYSEIPKSNRTEKRVITYKKI